jgi:hypothetical protein
VVGTARKMPLVAVCVLNVAVIMPRALRNRLSDSPTQESMISIGARRTLPPALCLLALPRGSLLAAPLALLHHLPAPAQTARTGPRRRAYIGSLVLHMLRGQLIMSFGMFLHMLPSIL